MSVRRSIALKAVASVLLLATGMAATAASASGPHHGMLSFTCDGTSAETRFLADQQRTTVKDGARVIRADGYVIYRIPIGNCTAERLYYSVSLSSYALEFSPDGRTWSPMVTNGGPKEQPDEFTDCSDGFVPESQKSARKTGTAYFRFSHPKGGRAPLVLKHVDFDVTGRSLPGFFRSPALLNWNRIPWAVPGALMILVGAGSVLLCWMVWRTRFRLFGLGALLWTISVAVKFAMAIPLNKPVSAALHHALPKHPADVSFWIYIGLLTGITEVCIFPALTRWFQRGQWSWKAAASVGVGFGAIEAILLGIGAMAAAAGKVGNASLLTGPVERLIAVVIHTTCAVTIIYAITRRQWGWFVFAFVYKSAVDAVAGYLLLSGTHLLGARPWFVELGLFGPFAYIGLPLMVILRRIWGSHSDSLRV